MKKQRKLVVGFLLLLALVVSGFTYAYWAGGIIAPTDLAVNGNSVKIGEGEDVVTTITASVQTSEKGLVPTAHVVNPGDDTETLTFNVTWAGDGATGATGTLSAVITNIKIDGQEINEDGLEGIMFEITPQSNATITAGTALDFTVTVVFAREPKDLETYNKVVNKAVTFTVTFTVVVTP